MQDKWPHLAGQIYTPLSIEQLAAALVAEGIQVQVRESCHYEGGRYVRIDVDGTDFSLEHLSGEFLTRADAESLHEVVAAASPVSKALARLDIRHRFEVYGGTGDLAGYLHHRWPK